MTTHKARRQCGCDETQSTAQLTEILLASLAALAVAGEPERACRLAGQACAALRRTDAAAWRRFNVLLHRLARHTAAVPEAQPQRAAAR